MEWRMEPPRHICPPPLATVVFTGATDWGLLSSACFRKCMAHYSATHDVLDYLLNHCKECETLFYWKAVYCSKKNPLALQFLLVTASLVLSFHWIGCLGELSSVVEAPWTLTQCKPASESPESGVKINIKNCFELFYDFPKVVLWEACMPFVKLIIILLFYLTEKHELKQPMRWVALYWVSS
jgi:hypothetical protein